MAIVTTASARISSQPEQRVIMNGVSRPEVECLSISESFGLRGNEAVFRLPYRFAGDDVSFLRDALVMVYARSDGAAWRANPDFVGYVDPESAVDESASSSVSIVARSVLSLMDRVYVGQHSRSAIVDFPKRNRRTGALTGWRLTSILQALFSPAALDSNWRAMVGLGSLRAVLRGEFNVELPDIGFHSTPYNQALRTLLSFIPDVSVREVYLPSGRTLLDFFRFGDPDIGERVVRVPAETQGPEEGAVATAYIQQRNNAGVRTRVLGYGAPAEFMVTVGTDNETDPLVPTWPFATPYFGEGAPMLHPAISGGLTALEGDILDEPDRAIQNSVIGRLDPEAHNTFRSFRIPVSLWDWIARDVNIVRETGGAAAFEEQQPEIGIQVFRETWPMKAPEQIEGVWTQEADLDDRSYELIDGARLDWKNKAVLLPRPAVSPIMRQINQSTKEVVTAYARPHVYITLTLFNPLGLRPVWDTGVRGLSFHPVINASGLTYSFVNENLRFGQVGTWTGGSFPAIWKDPSTGAWNEVAAGSGYPIVDDRPFLVNAAEKALAQRSQRPVVAEVRLPFFRAGYHVGEAIRILNRGIDNLRLQVVSVTRDLFDQETRIFATDEVPLTTASERQGVRRSAQGAGPGRAPSIREEEPDYVSQASSPEKVFGDSNVPADRNFPLMGQTDQQDVEGTPDLSSFKPWPPEDEEMARRVPDASPLERRRALRRDGSAGSRGLLGPRR